jgi:hypothetical protein
VVSQDDQMVGIIEDMVGQLGKNEEYWMRRRMSGLI